MRHTLARGFLPVAAFSLIAAQIPVARAAEPSGAGMPALAILAKATAARAPVMVSQPVVQSLPGETPRVVAPAATPAPPPVNETDKERKARLKLEAKALKQAEKAEKDRLKKEEKERKRAENKAKGGSKTGKKIAACLGGAILTGLLVGILGGNKRQVVGAAIAGCGAGLAFQALSEKDNQNLETYVNEDFLVQDESCSKTWYAPESQQTVALSCGQETLQSVQHTFYADEDVIFDPTNFVAAESAKYAIASLRLRKAPNTASEIVGGFDPGDRILTYGNQGSWTAVVNKDPDGKYKLLGWVASSFLANRPPPSEAPSAIQYAKLKPLPAAPSRTSSGRRATTAVAAAPSAPKATRTIVATATTRCKTANVSVGNETKSTSRCGGAKLAFNLSSGRKEKKA